MTARRQEFRVATRTGSETRRGYVRGDFAALARDGLPAHQRAIVEAVSS